MRWGAAAVSRNWLFHTKIGARVGLGEEDYAFRPPCRLHPLTRGLSSGDALSGLPISHRVAVEASAGRQLLPAPTEKSPPCPDLGSENNHWSTRPHLDLRFGSRERWLSNDSLDDAERSLHERGRTPNRPRKMPSQFVVQTSGIIGQYRQSSALAWTTLVV